MRIGIVGAGIFGLAAALELRGRGHQVALFEQGEIPYPQASSTDVSKAIRRTNYPEQTYVELVERAAHQWRSWHERLSRAIYYQPGKLMISPDIDPNGPIYKSWQAWENTAGGTRVLSLQEARRRFPQFTLHPDDTLLEDPWTGYLRSGQAVADLADLARAEGVLIYSQTPVQEIEDHGQVRFICKNDTPEFDRAVIAAGAWVTRLLPQFNRHLHLTRQQMAFFVPKNPELFEGTFPLWSVLSKNEGWYGFPLLQEGYVKVADDLKVEEITNPDIERAPTDEFLAAAEAFVADRIPALANAELIGGRSCLYTNTPDNHFVIDWLPNSQRLLVAGCGSGHGFKFGGSIGPVIADALEEKHNSLGDLFRIAKRFD